MFYRESGHFKTSYQADNQFISAYQDKILVSIIIFLFWLVLPLTVSEFTFQAILIPFVVFSTAALGLNILSELGSIQLSKIEILLQDKGLRKPLLLMLSSNLGMNEAETIQMAINALYSSLQAIIPQNIEKVEKSISEFLINGGKLQLIISPPNPVPIMAAGGLLMMPDLAIESLGVSLNHIP